MSLTVNNNAILNSHVLPTRHGVVSGSAREVSAMLMSCGTKPQHARYVIQGVVGFIHLYKPVNQHTVPVPL